MCSWACMVFSFLLLPLLKGRSHGQCETSYLILIYLEACHSGSVQPKPCHCHLCFLFSSDPSVLVPATMGSQSLMWLDDGVASVLRFHASVDVWAALLPLCFKRRRVVVLMWRALVGVELPGAGSRGGRWPAVSSSSAVVTSFWLPAELF